MASNGARARSVEVSVEKLLEHEIEEISRAGEEKYRKPLTFSEELTDFAHKIDFLGDEGDSTVQNGEDDEDMSDKKQDQSKAEQWPWESVRNKIRSALSEVCVLLDVLQVMKEKKYLVLEPVSQNAEPPKQVVQMIGKRKSLAKAADVIRLGAERMTQGKVEEKYDSYTHIPLPKVDYFSELMKLRQRWKVKKTGNAVTGELSYKSAGSTFWHPGFFEVKKTEDLPEEERDGSGCPLSVRVSSDLEDYSRVKVRISDLNEEDERMDVDNGEPSSNGTSSARDELDASPWHKKLKQAQHNIFCKELFSQISKEAFHSEYLQNVQVTGNRIRLQLFPDAFAEITYEKGLKSDESSYENLLSGYGDVLELRLQQLLHEQHLAKIDIPTPQPATAPWTTKDKHSSNTHEFLAKKNIAYKNSKPLLLDTYCDELKHIVLRKRTTALLDRMALEYSDPSIATEWSSNAGPKVSFANVHMFSKRQKLCYRTSFNLKIDLDKFVLINMNGTVVRLNWVLDDLEDYVKMQITIHFAHVALGIFEDFGWKILQHPNNISIDKRGQKLYVKARSLSQECVISLLVTEGFSFHASLQKSLNTEEEQGSSLLLDAKWTKLEGKQVDIDWASLQGKTFAEKFYELVSSNS
ncbi:mediator of RNA polymerase II transcription subunit 17-like [Rhopilema esculentum]|uniref:mediator of RNA polymerase II transcription subunit 17-like n=1 Tax=Rhopilema esculentum TaxID=499914 RepID=UPI0031DF735D|eukprot:gene2698-909_t